MSQHQVPIKEDSFSNRNTDMKSLLSKVINTIKDPETGKSKKTTLNTSSSTSKGEPSMSPRVKSLTGVPETGAKSNTTSSSDSPKIETAACRSDSYSISRSGGLSGDGLPKLQLEFTEDSIVDEEVTSDRKSPSSQNSEVSTSNLVVQVNTMKEVGPMRSPRSEKSMTKSSMLDFFQKNRKFSLK